MSRPVTIEDVRRAADAIRPTLPATPAWSYPTLDAVVGTTVVVKHENTQPTGAFKVRGGLALVATLTPAELARGLVTASTGNHAQSIAYAARHVGARAVIVAPEGSPAGKLEAVRLLGATVVVHGASMTEAGAEALRLADADGMAYVDPGDTPAIIAGHATVTLELLTQHPELTAIYVPVGSGTSAAGAIIVRDALAPDCAVIGVQSSAAPAAYLSWKAGSLVTAACETRHSGLATARGYALPQAIMAAGLDDFVLVTDDDIDAAAVLLATAAHTLAEGAGATALAGLVARAGQSGPCAVICSGGNASALDLAAIGRAPIR